MRALLTLTTALLAAAGPVRAQSFNIDLEHAGHSAGPLPDSYGAHPGLRGRWQKAIFPVAGPLPPTPLVDVYGLPTGATIESDEGGQQSSPNCGAIWLPDDVNLYDGIRRPGGAVILKLLGLEDGWYSVYVYGVDEQSQGTSATTSVRLTTPASTGGFIQYRAECVAAHVEGRTFAVADVRVNGGRLVLRFTKGGTPGQSFAFSALQLDRRVGTPFCPTSNNSTGAPSILDVTSTQLAFDIASIAANDLTLAASNIPANGSGFFIYSMRRHPGTGGYGSLGAGYRCLLGAVGRLPIADTQLSPGNMLHALDYSSAPSAHLTILAGSTWHFQGYYEDPGAGGFNMTNAVTVQFGP